MAAKAKVKKVATRKKNKYVVVRTHSAGVHVGEIDGRQGKEIILNNARRLWSWKGANTLSEVAAVGVGSGSRVSVAVPSILLTEAIEVIECTEAGEASLRAARWE